MGRRTSRARGVLIVIAVLSAIASTLLAIAAGTDQLSSDARDALDRLYRSDARAAALGRDARAVLVFPRIIRTGLVARPYTKFGGAYGEGALMKDRTTAGIYNFVSSSWALKTDATSFSCVIFLMTAKAEGALGAGAWELGAGPTVSIAGESASPTVAMLKSDAHAFVFGPQGPIALTSLEGTKIAPMKN